MTRVLIAGVSTRAAATSAAQAGFQVTAIDGYADRDQHDGVRALSMRRDFGVTFTAAAAATAASAIDCDAVAYLSNFENDPAAVAMLTVGRQLWGNPPEVLRRARDPFVVAALFRSHGIPTPRVASDSNEPDDWLLKPLSSGGGHGIRPWRAGPPVPRGWYVQQRIGDARFGAHGYRYCGSILAPDGDRQFAAGAAALGSAHQLAHVAAAEFGLVGVNGIDFIVAEERAVPLEINPRWSSSMELVERATGMNVFGAHAAACATGDVSTSLANPVRAVGKAIVFARRPCVIGDTDHWLSVPDIRDIPHAGESFGEGDPVCTVFADAADAKSCEAELVRRAEHICADLERWTPAAPRNTHGSPFTIHE
jgi:predicted ATP-grasp superfamily ATP-dependent carboligase